MDRQRSESLSGALGEPNIGKRWCRCRAQNVRDRIWNIMHGEFVNAKRPEFRRAWEAVHGFLGILVAPVIAQLKSKYVSIAQFEHIYA